MIGMSSGDDGDIILKSGDFETSSVVKINEDIDLWYLGTKMIELSVLKQNYTFLTQIH